MGQEKRSSDVFLRGFEKGKDRWKKKKRNRGRGKGGENGWEKGGHDCKVE